MSINLFNEYDKYGRSKVIRWINETYPERYKLDPKQGEYDRTDIDATGYTKSSEVWYKIECKDRWYPHTDFGGEWVIEDKKIKELRDGFRKGVYINTFSDDYIVVWDISSMSDEEIKNLPVKESNWKRTTVEDNGRVKKVKKLLPLSKAKIIAKMS